MDQILREIIEIERERKRSQAFERKSALHFGKHRIPQGYQLVISVNKNKYYM